MHPHGRPERRLNVVVGNEANIVVKGASVLISSHVDPAYSAVARDGGNVQHERPASTEPHSVRIDEQVIKLKRTRSRKPGRKSDDASIAHRSPDTSLGHRGRREHHDFRMGEQVYPIAFIRERRPAEDVAQYVDIALNRVANLEYGHAVSMQGAMTGCSYFFGH